MPGRKNNVTPWADRTGTLPTQPASIVDIKVDPRNRDTVYVVSNVFGGAGVGKVFASTNGGRTWSDASTGLPDLPAYTLTIDPRNGDLFLGNDNGVWRLPGGVGSWQRFGAGMPNTQVTQLVLNQTLNTLTAATYGRSILQLFLPNAQGASSGALQVLSGSNAWTGPIRLLGDTIINAGGTQTLQNGISTATLDIVGS